MDLYHYMFTYGGPQLLVMFMVFVVTPLLLRTLLKNRSWPIRIKYLTILWVATILIGYGDVFAIAVAAKKLCSEEAGMRVYSTGRTDGISGSLSIHDLNKYGFTYIESGHPEFGLAYRERIVNGKYLRQPVQKFSAQYELVDETLELTLPIVKKREFIRERDTGRILGEVVAFKFYPGWLDSRLIGFLGFSWTPPRCDDDYHPAPGAIHHYSNDFVLKVLEPMS
jgi:hypothetical protein